MAKVIDADAAPLLRRIGSGRARIAVGLRVTNAGLLILSLAAIPALASDLAVTQRNQTFSAPNLDVQIGDTVHFKNFDTVTHNITVKGGDDDTDDLGLQKPGVEVSHRFDTQGRFRVVCSIHPRMRMTVVVH